MVNVLTPGSEGSTFGGYPLASVVGTYAIKVLADEKLADNAKVQGAHLIGNLNKIMDEFQTRSKKLEEKGFSQAFEMHNEKAPWMVIPCPLNY